MEEILLAQEDSEKKTLGTEARMEAQPLKEALPEGGNPSSYCQNKEKTLQKDRIFTAVDNIAQ